MKKKLNNLNSWIFGILIIFAIPMTTIPPFKVNVESFAKQIEGTEDDDTLVGTIEDDNIKSGEGDDINAGDDGDDLIESGEGDDINAGDDGDDLIESGDGDDSLFGNDGADKFKCGDGEDSIVDYSEEEGDEKEDNCENF